MSVETTIAEVVSKTVVKERGPVHVCGKRVEAGKVEFQAKCFCDFYGLPNGQYQRAACVDVYYCAPEELVLNAVEAKAREVGWEELRLKNLKAARGALGRLLARAGENRAPGWKVDAYVIKYMTAEGAAGLNEVLINKQGGRSEGEVLAHELLHILGASAVGSKETGFWGRMVREEA